MGGMRAEGLKDAYILEEGYQKACHTLTVMPKEVTVKQLMKGLIERVVI